MTDKDNKIELWNDPDDLNEWGALARFYLPSDMPLQSGILHMEGWRVDVMSEYEDEYIVNAEFPIAEDQTCPFCGEKEFVRFGTRNQRFHDLPVHDKRVTIWVQRQRLRCNACTKMFQQRLDYIDTKHSMTERLVLYIQRESMRRTFTSIAEQIGVNEKTVRIIFNLIADKLESRRVLKTPKWLGIDEVFLTGKARAIFTDVGGRKPVELLPDRKKTTVVAFLRELERDKVQIVTMDMWNPYREAVQAVIPHATIIVDKFHIVRMANLALDAVRKNTRKQMTDKRRRQLKNDRYILLRRRNELTDQQRMILDAWIANYEKLGHAYVAKEMFCDVWEATTRDEAETYYEAWLDWIKRVEIAHAFYDVTRAVSNWRTEIFAYFDHPLTNAYTEALNGILKLIQRNGRGYTFKAIRAKLLYGSTL